MNIESLNKRLTPVEHAALFDAAKVRALDLQRRGWQLLPGQT
ncbi:hypothetical protein LJR084_005024 [Variovorax sp. LjRoot84]